MFDPPPKSRRRLFLRLLIPALLVSGLVIAVVVAQAGEETKIEVEYLDQMRDQASQLSRGGSSLASLFASLREVDREEFTTVFEGLTEDLNASLAFVANPPATESLIPVWSLYRQAVEAWDRGVAALDVAILSAADNPRDAVVVNEVADALAELRAGDNLFLDLKSEFERDEIPQPVSPLVSVRLVPADGGLASLAVGYVAAARSSTNRLGLRPGLMLSQIATEPTWQISATGQAVVPATEAIVFSVVVTNSGNIGSGIENLTLTLTTGEPEPLVIQAEIPPLAPDGQTTVMFAEIAVESETLYQVEVELVVVDPDADLTDNRLRVQFTVNPS